MQISYAELRARLDRGEMRKGAIWSEVERAAREGNMEAQFLLGYRHYISVYAKEKSRIWLQRAADGGHTEAARLLAELNEQGWARRRELLALAEAGDLQAQCQLACDVSANWDGLGTDLEMGRRWYAAAALQGAETAQYEYGLMLLKGEGGPVSRDEGLEWLQRAATEGKSWDAANVLSLFYQSGHAGLPIDSELSFQWRRRADELRGF